MTNQVQEESWATDVSNNSTAEPTEMAVNNSNTEMGDNEIPLPITQPEGNDENMDQETGNEEEKNSSTSDDQKAQCQICEENEAVVAFKPCGHTVVCIGDAFINVWFGFCYC